MLNRKIASFKGVRAGVLLVGLSMVAGCASAPAETDTSPQAAVFSYDAAAAAQELTSGC